MLRFYRRPIHLPSCHFTENSQSAALFPGAWTSLALKSLLSYTSACPELPGMLCLSVCLPVISPPVTNHHSRPVCQSVPNYFCVAFHHETRVPRVFDIAR